MAASSLAALVTPVRLHGKSLLAALPEPHAELLALVWGPRFDREHAHGLLRGAQPVGPQVWQTLTHVADQFDRLAGPQQQRVRQLIVRHHRRWDNAGLSSHLSYAPHSAH